MTPRERRAIRWGVALMVAASAMRAIPAAEARYRAQRAEIAAQASVVSRMRADLESMDALTDSVARARAALDSLGPNLMAASTAIEAFAEMSLRMRALADRFELGVQRVEQQHDTIAAPPFRRAAILVSFDCDSRGLLGALQALATEPPVLTVESLAVGSADPSAAPEVLHVDAALAGWYIGHPTEP